MSTIGKVAIGAVVVVGGVVAWKMLNPSPVQRVAKPQATTPAQTVNGFLNLATSVFNYFSKNPPSPQAVPGSNNAWDASADLRLPLLPGTTAYADSTRNDYLLD